MGYDSACSVLDLNKDHTDYSIGFLNYDSSPKA